jgi:hypothetical protein
MAQYTYATRLSEHIAETEEGYLLCTSCVLCRSGTQQYRESELDPQSGDDTLVDVFRPPAEVTAKKFLGSIAGKGVTRDHPGSGFLSALTHAWNSKGTVLNARVGPKDEDGNVTVIGDIVITDPTTVEQVKGGLRQLSLGYKYQLVEGDQGLEMRNLLCNHCAVVGVGRAGNARIVDAAPADGDLAPLLSKLSTGEDETEDEEIPMPKTKDEEQDQIKRLCDLLEQFLAKTGTAEAEDFFIAAPGDNREKPDTFTDLIPVETLPKSERGTNPVVDSLRMLKPFIQASGNRKAIDAFNHAMKSAKRGNVGPAERLIAACDRLDPTGSFQDAVDRRRRELLSGKTEESREEQHHAEDVQPKAETYQQMVDRVRRKQLSGKK